MPWDPVLGKYTLGVTPTPPPAAPDYLAPYVFASGDGGGAQGSRGSGDQSLGTPDNPGTTQSTGAMARDTMALASSMFGPGAPSYGQIAGTVLGSMAGLPGLGAIGMMGDRAFGISAGARAGDPVAARIGSGVPSQMAMGAMLDKSGAIGAGDYGSIGGKSPDWGGLGAGYDAGGNYGGSMDKGSGPGTNDGAGKGGSGANDPTWAARGGALRLPRRLAGGGPVGALRMGSIHTPSLPRAPAAPRLPRSVNDSAQVLRRMAPRRYVSGQ